MIDTLSDVLRAIRLSGAVFFKVEATTPWAAEAPAGAQVAPFIMPGVDHVIEYHVVTRGTCWGGIVNEPAIRLEEGDVICFPQGDAHVISSDPGMRGQPNVEAFRAVTHDRVPVSLSINGGGSGKTQLVCGFLGCDSKPFNPLLGTLPRVIHLRGRDGDSLPRLVELAVAESTEPRAGGDCVLSKLSELLFVEVVRRYVAELPPEGIGWFAALRDDNIGRALQNLHQHPAHDWSLEELGKECGLSRSVLAERFAQLVGAPPMQYLARWRIQLAASLLRSGKASLAEIADQVGYGSEAALSRAFKREVGVAPAFYRRGDSA
ncbi:MAG TPA: AraC family transcriptional regulator [Polyangiaceae bacterium]|nr:AraC family transcriptional regulator [Polyangiaceae bacterium]